MEKQTIRKCLKCGHKENKHKTGTCKVHYNRPAGVPDLCGCKKFISNHTRKRGVK